MNSNMKMFERMRLYLLPAVTILSLASPPAAAAEPADDKWQFMVMPYLWLPTIDATLKFKGRAGGSPEVDVKANPGDYLSEVEMAGMLAFEARKGKWLVYSDITYMKLSDDSSSVRSINFNPGLPPNPVSTTLNSGTSTDVYATIWTVAGGYNLVQGPKASLDLIAGARYLHLKATTDWRLTATVTDPVGGGVFPASGSVTDSGDVWDGIVGVKGRLKLGEGSWFVPYYLDGGAGGSQFTWQVQTGIGYAFRWGDLVLGYRYLAWEQDDNNKTIQDLKLYGFGLAGVFLF
jgi:hypothetical protein